MKLLRGLVMFRLAPFYSLSPSIYLSIYLSICLVSHYFNKIKKKKRSHDCDLLMFYVCFNVIKYYLKLKNVIMRRAREYAGPFLQCTFNGACGKMMKKILVKH